MRKMKRILSFLLAFAMIFGCFANTSYVFAEETDVSVASQTTSPYPILDESDIEITAGNQMDVSRILDVASGLEEVTIIVSFTRTGGDSVGSLFSISNSATDKNHLHLYTTNDGKIGAEIRNDSNNLSYSFSGKLASEGENVVAFRADKESKKYKFYVKNNNFTWESNAIDNYRYASAYSGLNNVKIGATMRNGNAQYRFAGNIRNIKVYGQALSDDKILAIMNGTDTSEERTIREVILEDGETFTDTLTVDYPLTLATAPDSEVVNAEVVEVTREETVPVYDHSSEMASSLNAFSTNENQNYKLKDSEFEFRATGTEGFYQIYNSVTNEYLTNGGATDMCVSGAVNMRVEKVTDESTGNVSFHIANGSRYVMFYLAKMNFNCNGSSNMDVTANTDYNLVLFEKKALVENEDIIPGYQRVTEIEAGKKYLITAIFNDRVIVFCPATGSNAINTQAKLVGGMDVLKTVYTYEVRTTANGLGATRAVVDNVIYDILVRDGEKPVIVSDSITATAGSQNSSSGDESASAAVDGNTGTIWHTNYNNNTDKTSRDNHWITIDLGEECKVEGLRYLTRGADNGIITKYAVSYSIDNVNFTPVKTGTWAGAHNTWYEAAFVPIVARYVKLQSLDSKGSNGIFAAAAEIQIRGLKKADYNALDAAIEEATALNKIAYVDFSVVEAALERADAVSRELFEDEQGTVDEATQELTSAIAALQLKPLEVESTFLSLDDNISVNYKIDAAEFPKDVYENLRIEFEFNEEPSVVSEFKEVDGQYVFEFADIAPQCMNDIIYATVCAEVNEEAVTSEVTEYSVNKYCYDTLVKYQDDTSDFAVELKTLIVDLLNYGAAAQKYTNYNTGNLVNNRLNTEEAFADIKNLASADVENPVSETEQIVIENPSVNWYSVALRLNNAVNIRYKIQVTDTTKLANMTVQVKTENGKPVEIKSEDFVDAGNGYYYVYFKELNAGQMSVPFYATVYVEGTPVSNTLKYSVESYVAAKQNDSSASENLKNLLKEMIKYGYSANRYAN